MTVRLHHINVEVGSVVDIFRGRILKACGKRTLVASVHLWRLITGLFVNKHLNRERFGDFGRRIIMVARFFYCKPNFRNYFRRMVIL